MPAMHEPEPDDGLVGEPLPADFAETVRGVKALGGKQENRKHGPRHTRFVVKGEDKFVERCSCKEPNLIEIPYEDQKGRTKRFVCCIVCDSAWRFPRLRAAA